MAEFGDFSLITVISNKEGMGPGHSAIAIRQTVYSVEVWNVDTSRSAWLTISLEKYVDWVEKRPLIFQNLNNRVDRTKCLEYIEKSKKRDDDYFTDGVCSSQAGATIQAGLVGGGGFNATWGFFDTPYAVFTHAYKMGIVASTHFYWRDEAICSEFMRHHIGGKIESDFRPYFDAHNATGVRDSYAYELTPPAPPPPPTRAGMPGPVRHGKVSAQH